MNGIMRSPQSQNVGTAYRLGAGIGKFLSKDDMNAYQKAELERKQKTEERKIAIENIGNIDAHAAMLEKQGDPEAAQALLQSNKALIAKWQSWRISGDRVLPTYDAITLTTKQIADETALIQAKQTKGYMERTGELVGDPIEATKELEKSIDRVAWVGSLTKSGIVPEANTVFGASLQVATSNKLEVDRQLAKFPRDPVTGEIMGTKEQKEEVENLESIRDVFTTQIQEVVRTAPANVVKQVEAALTSEIEKGGEVTPLPAEVPLPTKVPEPTPSRYTTGAGQTGEALRRKLLEVPTRAVRAIRQAPSPGEVTEKFVRGGMAFMGLPELPAYDEEAMKAMQLKKNIVDKLGEAIYSKQAPAWKEKVTDPISEMLYKALYGQGTAPKATNINEELLRNSIGAR